MDGRNNNWTESERANQYEMNGEENKILPIERCVKVVTLYADKCQLYIY